MSNRYYQACQHAPVEVALLDVAEPLRLGAADEDDVRGDELVRLDAYDVAHADVAPRDVDERARASPAEDLSATLYCV
jgi:hypothetical protein